VEEAELDAAGAQELVERGDEHVAGAALELPAERALVGEGGAQEAGEQGAGLVVGRGGAGVVAAGVAAAVGEGRVVDDAQEHRAGQELAVFEHVRAQPGAEVEVVDRLEAAREDAVAEQADEHRGGEVEEDPQAARAVGGERATQRQPGAAAGEREGADGELDGACPLARASREPLPPWSLGRCAAGARRSSARHAGRDRPHGRAGGQRVARAPCPGVRGERAPVVR
jgi:hypothetical protein